MSSQAIKDRVRKLMAVAGDGVASEAEIETAMRLAAKLMDSHHLTDADIGTQEDADDLKMGRAKAYTGTSRLSTWEVSLGRAIVDLIGCVKWYISRGAKEVARRNGVAKLDANGNVKICNYVTFYGPIKEAEEAQELFEEWGAAIAAMGVARWGGCYRGDGAMYCDGFCEALKRIAYKINRGRQLASARPIPQLQGSVNTSTAITLTARFDLLKESATKWLEEEQGVKLGKGGRGGSGYSAGSSDARRDGYSQGEKSGFSRQSRTKRLNGGS